jgi:hypothetical protein
MRLNTMRLLKLRQPMRPTTLVATLLACMAASPAVLQAQQPAVSSSLATPDTDTAPAVTAPVVETADVSQPIAIFPDAPSAVLDQQSGQKTTTPPASNDADGPKGPQQTKRILGIMPNFRSVSADTKLPPLSPKQKFLIAGHDTFDYSSFLIAGLQAGFSMNGASYPEFHQGLKGYGRYYWHTLADTIDENFMVGGLGPIVFHQDNRFYTLGHGGFRKRAFYAATRVLISRKDDGSATFNYSEVIGSGAASGISTLYYPTRYRTWTKVGQKWLTSDLIDGANFMLKEFWPDINHALFHTH